MPIIIDISKADKALKKLADLPKSTRRQMLNTYGNYLRKEIRQRAPISKKGKHRLGNSFALAYDDERAVVGSPLPWARITHYGGTIRPSGDDAYEDPPKPLQSRRGSVSEVTGKPIKNLAIPINARKNTRPRDYQNTFVFQSKKGNLLIAQKATRDLDAKLGRSYKYSHDGHKPKAIRKKKERIRLLFLLLKQVVVPARPYAEQTEADKRNFVDIIKEGIAGLLTS